MAEHNTLYQNAVYYDVIFNRDVSREVEFITALYRQFTGERLESILDLACGPGYHARAFARQGHHVVGLDLRPEMIAFARDQAEAEETAVTWLAADMRQFQLERPVSMAICMFDGMDALLTNREIVAHFQAVAANLEEGGLYFLEFTHPRDCSITNYVTFTYRGERDGISVEIRWAYERPQFDLVAGVVRTKTEMHVTDHGRRLVIHDTATERMFVPQELQLLADLSGVFQVAGWYGDYDLNQPLDSSPASQRMLLILQKVLQSDL